MWSRKVLDRTGQDAQLAQRLPAEGTWGLAECTASLLRGQEPSCFAGAENSLSPFPFTGIAHHPVNPSQKVRVKGPFHIQNVNAYDSRLKEWMSRFHGVAMKYLSHYLGWRRLLERYRAELNPLICLKEALGQLPMQQLTQT